jgi:hypothetical protein
MPDRSPQRLKFVSLELEETKGGHRAIVTLEIRPDRTFVGRADCGEGSTGDLRCAALATVDALHRAIGDAGTLDLIGARAVKAFDATVVIVALSVRHRQGKRRLVGSYLAEQDLTAGAAIAVLNATNRLLGTTTFS